ncbi:8430_t:CDS:2 [Cetraspora pellucida]|uniref:8430_t:CDS:1 n=1 Tax=Cetraspora pellucida TaxID=1433469 RepID=A0A9N9EP95_9GLOM|nr:8430_t:CDS:2 [Cetraspora pellucida]
MWVNTFPSKQVNGTITIASFSDDKSCTLNPVPINTVILLVPFNEGLNYGCSSYSDIIESNIWLQKRSQTIIDSVTVASKPSTTYQSSTSEYYSMVTHTTTGYPTDTPTSTMTRNPGTITTINISSETSRPDHWNRDLKLKQREVMNHINPRDTTNDSSPGIEMLIFTSMNGGYPGIKEKYVGSLQTLSKTAPALTLIRIADMSNVYDFLNQTSYAVVTRALGLIVWGIYKNNYTLDNPKPWLLAGIILCATFRITDDLSFVIGCTVLLIALHSDSISKYSHMTYVSSPEDTGTENSRDTSRSSSNGGGTSTRNDRRKRTTIEILFGRKSFVGL